MDNKQNKPINRTKRSTSSPMSAEEKLRKSMRGLSYTGSSASGSKLSGGSSINSANTGARKKVGGVVLDIDTIQDAHNQKFETKGRRNNVVILILSLLLVVSLVYLVIAFMGYKNGKKEANLKYFVEGEAEWVIAGSNKTEITLRKGLTTDKIYLIDSALKVNTKDSVKITIEIKLLLEGEPILVPGLNEASDLVRVENNTFEYKEIITGGGTIPIFKGINFSDAPTNLTSDNISIEVKAYVTKV